MLLLRGFRLRSICFGGIGLCVFASETLDAAGGIEQFLLAGKERVTGGANFNADVALMGRTGHKRVTARAMDAHFVIARMNGWLHGFLDLECNPLILQERERIHQPQQSALSIQPSATKVDQLLWNRQTPTTTVQPAIFSEHCGRLSMGRVMWFNKKSPS